MRVRILGSGSAGNSTIIQSGRTRVLIDAGLSARELQKRLAQAGVVPSSLRGIIITHEHTDHIRGLRLFAKRHRVNLYSSERSFEDSGILEKEIGSFQRIEAGIAFGVGELEIHPFSLPHDAEMTFGFIIKSNGAKVSYATDFGHASKLVVERMKGSDGIILEANHDRDMLMNGPYPWFLKERLMSRHGHLSNDSMAELAEQVIHEETRFLILAHLSETNNTPALAMRVAKRAARRSGAKGMKIIASAQGEISDWAEL